MITLTSDVADLILQRTLGENSLGLNNSINRMTTGYKVNQAKDNAAGYSIITDLSKKISSMLQVQQNTDDGISLLQTAEGGLEEVQKLLERLRDLATQASNGTYDSDTRESMQAEADQIIEQISQIRDSIKYDNQNLYYKENNVKTSVTTQSRIMKAQVFSLSAQSGTIEGAEAFAGGETRTITIDGVQYTVKNKLSTANDLSYSKDTSTGELTLTASNFEIRGQEDVSYNLVISGISNNIYGSSKDDIFSDTSTSGSNIFYGLAGNDTVMLNGNGSRVYGGDGDDVITLLGSACQVYGEAGNDTINLERAATIAEGGDGDDIFNIKVSTNWKINGNDGNDTFNIIGNQKNLNINGGSGINMVTGEINSTMTLVNVDRANSYTVDFNKNETKTININGIDYIVTNGTTSQTLIYKINDDGQIEFSTSGAQMTIKGDVNKSHNVVLKSSRLVFYGGNIGDEIKISGDVTVYCGDGDNTITLSSSSIVYGGKGKNIFNISTSGCTVYSKSKDDTINVSGNYNYIQCENGANVNIKSGMQNMVWNLSGTGTIIDNGKNSFISGFGDLDNSTAILLDANANEIIKVNGIEYSIKNRQAVQRALFYSVNAVTDEVSFAGIYVDIKGQDDVEHNVNLYGFRPVFSGGSRDDSIKAFGHDLVINAGDGDDTVVFSGNYGSIYGGDGNDLLFMDATNGNLYGEAGDDTLTINNNLNGQINGGLGNDTYNINAKVTNLSDTGGDNIYNVNANDINISGGPGADTFYLSGNNNTVLGAGGDDYFVIDGSNNFIDGGTGKNYYIDNGTGTSFSNVNKDPNAGGISFTYQGEVKTFTLNGKTYTVTNNFAGSNMLQYSLNPNTGVITLNGSNFGVNASSNESAILNIRGNNNVINGSDLSDKITVEQGSNNVINGGKGNDTLIMNSENNSLNGGEGNDNITLNASTNLEVTGGAGADTININSDNNTHISSGAGNDVIKVNGAHNNINTGEGNNSITVNKDNNTINSGDGDNKYVITSSSNTVTAGKGNNSIGVQGDDNNITTQNAKGDINIYGNNNTVSNTRGENQITINGEGNSYSSMLGDKKVTIIGTNNDVTTGAGDDQIEVKGDNNTIESTSGNNEISIKGDSNTIQGGAGQDNIKINGDNNIANGGAESDSFMVSNGNNNTIDGEGGERNTLIDNGKNTVYTNAVDITPRPFELNIKVDIGSGSDKYISTSISFNLFDFSVDFSTAEGALESLESIDEMLSSVSDQLLNIGNTINRLESVSEAQSIKLNNLISFRSTMRDADIAEESSNYIRYQILQQASATLLASSRNLKAQNVMGLLNSV